MSRYSQAAAEGRDGQAVINEFKAMVKACHRRGMEVFMDVVFNHTAEGNEQGPSISFRCQPFGQHVCFRWIAGPNPSEKPDPRYDPGIIPETYDQHFARLPPAAGRFYFELCTASGGCCRC